MEREDIGSEAEERENREASQGTPQAVPKKLTGHEAPEELYTHLKKMILSGKLRKGQRLLRWKFVQIFDVSEWTVMEAFSKLRKDGLVIIKTKVVEVRL